MTPDDKLAFIRFLLILNGYNLLDTAIDGAYFNCSDMDGLEVMAPSS